MDPLNELKEEDRCFLVEMFRRGDDDPLASVSMHEIGERLKIDRQKSSHISEVLISFGLVDLRSLSGAIALTAEGRQAARAIQATGGQDGFTLGRGPLLDDVRRQAVETITTDLKQQTGELGLDFDALNELNADLRTIETQLASPRPKTAIVRACFQSIRDVLKSADDAQAVGTINVLLSG